MPATSVQVTGVARDDRVVVTRLVELEAVICGFLSLGARILLPGIAGVTLTQGLALEERDDGYGAAFGAGFAIGAVGAIALDWFVLTPSGTSSSGSEQQAPLVTQTISASAEHVFLGLGGSL